MRIRLNALNINTLAPKDGRRTNYKDIGCPGLVLRVSRSTRVWCLTVSRRRRKVRLLLGYHQVPGGPAPKRRVDAPLLSLAEARDAVEEELRKADRGIDTVAARSAGTCAELVARCIKAKAILADRTKKPARPASIKEWTRLLDACILGTPVPTGGRRRKVPLPRIRASFADLPAIQLRRPEVRAWIAPIAIRAPVVANAVLGLLKMTWAWACSEEILPMNELSILKLPGPKKKLGRFLLTAELRALWLALAELADKTASADATALLLLTGVRRRMVLEMRIQQFEDLDGEDPRWMIGEEGTKGHRAHLVPLSPQGVTIVKRRIAFATENKVTHLFPVGNESWGEDRPMSWSSGWVRRVKKRTREIYGAEMEPWRVHAMRHTIRTHMAGTLRLRDEVGALIIMHKRGGIDGVYNLAELIDERRAALVAWAAWLDKLASGDEKKTADVLPLTGRR